MSNPVFDNPSFFKVMIAHDFRTILRIPPLFMKNYGEMMRRTLVLRSRGGREWKIKVRVVGEEMYFREGWESFVSDNGISLGDFLIFFYDGAAGCDVKVFGKSGCEKEEPVCSSERKEEPICVPSEEVKMKGNRNGHSEAAKQKISLSSVSLKRKCRVLGKCRVKKNKLCYKVLRAAYVVENEKALKAACSIKLTHTHFISTCRTSRTGYMTVPKGLVRRYKLDKMKLIILRDPEGTSWPVKLASWRDGRYCLTSGWALLYEKNGLKEGDVCVFEFVDGGSEINVHIIRAEVHTAQLSKKKVVVQEERLVDEDDEERVLRAAKSFESTHPKFVVYWTLSRFYHVPIPKRVATKVGIEENRHTILSDPYGRQWPVQIVFRTHGQIELGSGLAYFSKANNLVSGDACVFEFIHGADAINVHIFRVGETGMLANELHPEQKSMIIYE